jgi:polyphenol oxidase
VFATSDDVGGLGDADAIVSSDDSSCPAVLTADCVSVALGSPEGVRAAVHAGWRGLVAGVIGAAAGVCAGAGGSRLVAGIGPCIGPCCYEFSPDDLDRVEQVLGAGLRSTTTYGRPSLDIRSAAVRQLEHAGIEVVFSDLACTACGDGWFSARAHNDIDRQALYVWRES